MPSGVSPKDAIDTEAMYRAGQVGKVIKANRMDDDSFDDIDDSSVQREFERAQNSLLKPSEGGRYHGLLDIFMTGIVGHTMIQAAQDTGAETYTFYAILDERTTRACRTLNGRTFKTSDMQLGYNVPPIVFELDTGLPIPHPCRSWVILHRALTKPDGESIIKSGGDGMVDRKASGLRRSPFNILSESEIIHLKNEIHTIKADEKVFKFNEYIMTAYHDNNDKITVRTDVFPEKKSIHPRDLMSERAVLAHEYYGHRAYRNTKLEKGSWNDEFRASYMAAKNAPNLTDEDRQYLVLDAIERAKEAGVRIKYNDFIRRILYGY